MHFLGIFFLIYILRQGKAVLFIKHISYTEVDSRCCTRTNTTTLNQKAHFNTMFKSRLKEGNKLKEYICMILKKNKLKEKRIQLI